MAGDHTASLLAQVPGPAHTPITRIRREAAGPTTGMPVLLFAVGPSL